MAKKRSGKPKSGAARKSISEPGPDKTVELHIPPRLYDIIYDPNHPLPEKFTQHMIESLFGDRELFGISHVKLVKKPKAGGSGRSGPGDPRKVCDGT